MTNANLKRLPRNYSMLTDWYEMSMNDAYVYADKHDSEVVFDVFFRKIPNNGGYAVMAGVDKLIEYIKNLRFDDPEDVAYLQSQGLSEEHINLLKNFKFTGDIKAIPDGTPVFPNEPLVTVRAPLLEAAVIETAILSLLNGSMEHATGARRIIEATPEGVPVMEFGARRADGFEAAIDASIYGVMAGCAGTSNTIAAQMMGQKALGTMAHHFIESFDNELDAFKAYATRFPNNAMLLVDTYDTLESGVPNAIKTFDYMKEQGLPLDHIGIRIDSGDLAYLSKEARRMLDEAGYPQAKICLSNGLTAEVIRALKDQGAVFDSLGVGDNISKPAGRMGCVYKEVAVKKDGKWDSRIKLSNDTIKITNPGFKNLYRLYDKNTGFALADVMNFEGRILPENDMMIYNPADTMQSTMVQNYNAKELQKYIFKNGEQVYTDPNIDEKKAYCNEEMNKLYPEVRRELNPHLYKVSGTKEYVDSKENLINDVKAKVYKKER
jgi:nicotinate phosphoribosyltransferase